MNKPASFRELRFSCPHCGALAHQHWYSVKAKALKRDEIPTVHDKNKLLTAKEGFERSEEKNSTQLLLINEFLRQNDGEVFLSNRPEYDEVRHLYSTYISRCDSCGQSAVWLKGKMIHPASGPLGQASADMPETVKGLFDEAGAVFSTSPRASAALLRLALQHLLKELGESGADINKDIVSLEAKGLNDDLAKQMHAVRIVGNESVHPGQIDVNDEPYIAEYLFELLNEIVDQMITKPKKRQAIWERLPEGKRRHVEQRLAKRQSAEEK